MPFHKGGIKLMAKVDLTLPDGTTVAIDGSPQEITKILTSLGAGEKSARAGKPRKAKPPSRTKAQPKGPTTYIVELRDEGFFKQKRSLNEIQKKLEERGHIYARTSISPILVKLVRRKDLRRIKDGSNWAYVF
jgi:hypothetical protein